MKEKRMKPTTTKTLFSVTAVIFLLAACAPAAAPTQDPAEVQKQIQESVALTVAAQSAATNEAQALIQPSNTPLPTQTEAVPPTPTLLLPTATPFEIVPPTLAPSSGGGGGSTVVKADYACDAINRKPYDNQYFKPNAHFDIKWTIVNTGTKAWPAGYDLKYFSGPEMSTTNRIELPAMAPGDQFNVDLDGVAPSKQGFAVMTWTIDGQICFPYVAIIVEK